MEVRLLSVELDSMPDIGQMVEADDPEVARETLIRLGYPQTAERDYRIAIVEQHFKLMGKNASAYYWFYGKHLKDGSFGSIPPLVLAQLIAADKKKAFDEVIFRGTEDDQQRLVIGVIKYATGTEEFLVAQWSTGPLTSLEDIVVLKLAADEQEKYHLDKEAATKRARESRQRFRSLFVGPLQTLWAYRESLALTASIGLYACSIPGSSWWLLPGGLLTIGSAVSISRRWGRLEGRVRHFSDEHSIWYSGRTDPIKIVTSWLIVASVGMFASTGILSLVDWNDIVRTNTVLVCDIHVKHVLAAPDIATINGPQGKFTLKSGMYDGIYYQSGVDASKSLHKGETLRVTFRGGRTGPSKVMNATRVSGNPLGVCAKK